MDRVFADDDRRSALHDETFWSLRETPKQLSPKWLYDHEGSLLFDRITRLPEYYPFRAERSIILERAAEIAGATAAETLVELGSGTSEKTRLLLDALVAAGTLRRFVPLDVSEEILRSSAAAIAERYPELAVHAIVGDFERHLAAIPPGRNRLVAFLGSTIGNLHPEGRLRFLARVAAILDEGDTLLLGVDLVKPADRLRAAYDDALGLTERFIRNGLTAVDRELGSSFSSAPLDYEATWDPVRSWMDISFRAREAIRIPVPVLEVEVELAADEQLRMEVSTKFTRAAVEEELTAAGLRPTAWWTDGPGDFALCLAVPAAG
ncbi:MAG: L-histidine N(alpha)-methyltransferase [Actinobacteria bacterium]|nr:L-histidine N(alpha)-methyltransferase [Actinomycetota bacterium]